MASKNVGPIGSAVLSFIRYKQIIYIYINDVKVPVVVPLQNRAPPPSQPSNQPRPPVAYASHPHLASTGAGTGSIGGGQGYLVNYAPGVFYSGEGEGLVERLEEISLLQDENKDGVHEPDTER